MHHLQSKNFGTKDKPVRVNGLMELGQTDVGTIDSGVFILSWGWTKNIIRALSTRSHINVGVSFSTLIQHKGVLQGQF